MESDHARKLNFNHLPYRDARPPSGTGARSRLGTYFDMRPDCPCLAARRLRPFQSFRPEAPRIALTLTLHGVALYLAGGCNLLESIMQTVRYLVRQLKQSRRLTLTALSLALGIGAITAIFQLVDAIRLKMLSVRNPQELVSVDFKRNSSRCGLVLDPERSRRSVEVPRPFSFPRHSARGNAASGGLRNTAFRLA